MLGDKQIRRPRVLLLFGASGRLVPEAGPVQSLRALIAGLQEEFSFHLLAGEELRSKDHRNMPLATWTTRDGAEYYWLPQRAPRQSAMWSELGATTFDLIVLSSFFDREFTMPLLLNGALRPRTKIPPVLLAPRGEFAEGAMSIKPTRKRLWLGMVRCLGLSKNIWFQATADHERRDIEASRLPCRGILQAPNARVLPDLPNVSRPDGLGPLRIAFLGRVSPVKNLDFALDVLGRVSVPVVFDIYGPKVDTAYWDRLNTRIAKLPDHITVTAHGALPHDRVSYTMATHDLFFLPTLGENFGHAINEALSAGLPALIADTTPWRRLQAAGAGWDLPLAYPERFVAAIEDMASADTTKRQSMRAAARRFAEDSFAASDAVTANRRMFHTVLEMYQPGSGDN